MKLFDESHHTQRVRLVVKTIARPAGACIDGDDDLVADIRIAPFQIPPEGLTWNGRAFFFVQRQEHVDHEGKVVDSDVWLYSEGLMHWLGNDDGSEVLVAMTPKQVEAMKPRVVVPASKHEEPPDDEKH